MRFLFPLLLATSSVFAQNAVGPWVKQPIDTVSSSPADADHQVRLRINRSVVIDFPKGFRRISITNGDICEAVAVSSTELLLNGKAAGDTSLIIWDQKGGRTSYEVHVAPDSSTIEAVRQQLVKDIGSGVSVQVASPNVFLEGTVPDPIVADRAAAIAGTLGKVVNLLNVQVPPGEPQILLKVRFASLDRTVAAQLGVNLFSNKLTKGIVTTGTGQFGGPPNFSTLGASTSSSTLTDLLNIFYYRPDIDMGAVLQDLETRSVLQILAQPDVLALSGHPASFLAGGEFPFPTLQGGGSGVGQVTIQFREFGIRLKFVPTVTPRGTIHLLVNPEVSSLDYSNGLTVNGFTVPGLSTRRVETEVELENGQSFAIAGLLDDQTTETLDRMPGISSIPVLGKLFQSKNTTKSKSELLVVVTPELVHPIPSAESVPQLEQPKKFLPGALPDGWERPVDPAGAALALPKVPALPVELMKDPSSSSASPAPSSTAGPAAVPSLKP